MLWAENGTKTDFSIFAIKISGLAALSKSQAASYTACYCNGFSGFASRSELQHRSHMSIIQNKKARFDFFIEENHEAGMVLEGWEVKAIRAGARKSRKAMWSFAMVKFSC